MVTEKLTLAEKNHLVVYQTTTKPKKKTKRRDKSDLGPDFVAPDGGWGWVICFAAGFCNLSMFPALQQYGLIYRQRMENLGFDAKDTTTIVNGGMAISSLIGIVNGAMFRRFSFRQVAIFGSILVFVGIFASAFCTTFAQYIICFSATYGIGLGLCLAANSLAVNTYFKTRRRRATGFTWTITGLGPIILPHVTTYLLGYCGLQGTILLYAAFSLNALLCSLTLQPVMRHVRKSNPASNDGETDADTLSPSVIVTEKEDLPEYECKYCQYQKRHKRGIFSSQYLFNEDDPNTPGYEITEPGTPMLARANDGWFGSKLSLASEISCRYRNKGLPVFSQRGVEAADNKTEDGNHLFKPNYFNREREDRERYASKISIYSKQGLELLCCTCADDKAVMQKMSDKERKLEKDLMEAELVAELVADDAAKQKMTLKQKIVKFFDLDLLRDFTFVNLALGMTIMMFGEMNFSVLTPFILHSYGYSNEQISLAMSFLGGMDISVRFLAPLCLERVKLDNRVLFSFGIIVLSIGRFIVTTTNSFNTILMLFVMIGFGKGFRTIFSPLIIPSYVPLKRLPAASGLQLLFNSLFSVVFGPILGIITDTYSYSVAIHFINILTTFALLMWLIESFVRKLQGKKSISMKG